MKIIQMSNLFINYLFLVLITTMFWTTRLQNIFSRVLKNIKKEKKVLLVYTIGKASESLRLLTPLISLFNRPKNFCAWERI